jgi:hypothetical protein
MSSYGDKLFHLRRVLRDPDLVAVAETLVGFCDSAVPPFSVALDSWTSGAFRGTSIDHRRCVVTIAVDDPQGVRRSPLALIVSLAHEVGHLLDPLTARDETLVLGTEAYLQRQIERETTAWAWASSQLAGTGVWPRLQGVFDAARARALAEYGALLPTR